MQVMTIELLVKDDEAGTLRDALDLIANRLSDEGYTPGEFRGLSDVKSAYRIVKGYVKDAR